MKSTEKALIKSRFIFLLGLISAMLFALFIRSFYLQYLESDFLNTEGEKKHIKYKSIPANRGSIYDRNGIPLAVSIPIYRLIVDPKTILKKDNYSELLEALSNIISKSASEIDSEIRKRSAKRYYVLKRELRKSEVEIVREDNFGNYIYLETFYKRFYPNGETSSHLLGFTDSEGRGQEGLEYVLNSGLSGRNGLKKVLTDIHQNSIADIEMINDPMIGEDFYSSVDIKIQHFAHQALKSAIEKHNAKGGSVVVMDVTTGEIIAISNQPAGDLSLSENRIPKIYKNKAITDKFEPGSTFKTLTMAAALENQIFQADDTIDTAPYKIGSTVVKDPRDYGILSMEEVLIKSSNAGISRISIELEPCDLYSVFKKLGFGEITSSGFPGEASGTLDTNCNSWRERKIASLSYGYGIDVSLIQLASAYATIANKGIKQPITLKKIESKSLDGIRILSEETSKDIMAMLEKVAIRGAPLAKINGYRIGGKTGTAQIAAANYSSDRHNAIFVGVVPLSQPKLSIAVIVNEPRGEEYYGGRVAGPVFSEIGSHSLKLLGIAPDDK
jgi:cell division protein FtsI (penicillin-binding protein 3)